jgi:hypothetical protein
MVRWIVYEEFMVTTPDRQNQGNARIAASPAPQMVPRDTGYSDKLIKYVPAEVVTFFGLVYQAAPSSMEGTKEPADLIHIHILMVVVFFFFTPFYQMLIGAPVGTTPLHFYPLSAIAFFGWALGTTTFLKDVIGADKVDDLVPSIILAGTVLIIPAIDGFLTAYYDNQAQQSQQQMMPQQQQQQMMPQQQQPSNALVPTGRPNSKWWSNGLLLVSVVILFIVALILLLLNLILDRQC